MDEMPHLEIGAGRRLRASRAVRVLELQALKQRAFTVTELLIVILILALAAIFVSSGVGRAVAYSRNVKCLGNLRQIGMANLAFAQDNNQRVAAGGTWRDYWWQFQIRSYLGGNSDLNNVIDALICPADPHKGWGQPATAYHISRRSYGVNNFLRNNDNTTKRLSELNPQRTVYAGDTGKAPSASSWISGAKTFLDDIPKERHGGHGHYVFLDGRAEAFTIQTLYPAEPNHYIFTGAEP